MMREGKRRSPRIPKTPEEIAELVFLKKLREHKRLESFKKTLYYKAFNLFCIICFFTYCELIICFMGPCHYQDHHSKNVWVEYGREAIEGNHVISLLKVVDKEGQLYEFVVNEFIEPPPQAAVFTVGKDFLLQKEIKGTVSTSEHIYRINRASPILFLSFFVALFSIIFFSYNLNQNPHSLRAITVINALTIFSFLLI
jgi:hypothetical protein